MKMWLLSFTLIVGGFFGMMRMKADVTALDRERLTLVNQQYQLQERIRILNADLALLKNPNRLLPIANAVGFETIKPIQFLAFHPTPQEEKTVE